MEWRSFLGLSVIVGVQAQILDEQPSILGACREQCLRLASLRSCQGPKLDAVLERSLCLHSLPGSAEELFACALPGSLLLCRLEGIDLLLLASTCKDWAH